MILFLKCMKLPHNSYLQSLLTIVTSFDELGKRKTASEEVRERVKVSSSSTKSSSDMLTVTHCMFPMGVPVGKIRGVSSS